MALLTLHQRQQSHEEAGRPLKAEWVKAAQEAAARGVLAVMPAFDKLIKEIEN